MTQPNIVLFTFAGRRPNMELLIPYMKRILAEHPNVQWDIWNLARDPEDAEYLQTIMGERITVRNDYYRVNDWWTGLADVWKHYADPSYAGTVFVKTDDDTAFVETDRFGEFVQAAIDFPDHVVSALVVNNGASTRFLSGVQEEFDGLGIPLLDVHMSNEYAEKAHEWFWKNWREVVNAPILTAGTEEWTSINWIAYQYPMAKRLAELIGQSSPPHIAGRDWPAGSIIGDEGAVNMMGRIIHRGFVVAHLTFGPQYATDEQQDRWRGEYAKIAQEYLA